MRLHKSSDYQKLFDKGQKYYSKHLIVFAVKNNGPTRLGLTVSRKVGGAVVRNKLKRRLREIFRLSLFSFLIDTDIMIVAKKSASSLDYEQLSQEIYGICSRMKK